MPYLLEPAEGLRSPAYWDGIDITQRAPFEVPLPHMELISPEQVMYAESMLLGAVHDALGGAYIETDIPADGQSNGMSSADYPDGTVVVVDKEWLSRTECDSLQPKLGRPAFNRGPKIEAPYVPHWIQQQDPDRQDIAVGSECALFPEKTDYSRALMWGVLLTGEETGVRLLKTWNFSALRITHGGLDLLCGRPKDELYRYVGCATLRDRAARPQPRFELPAGRTRVSFLRWQQWTALTSQTIERVRSAHIIYTANGSLPEPPSIERFSKRSRPIARVAV